MKISELSVDALDQLEARLAADLEMVRRVKAVMLEYQQPGGGQAAMSPMPAAAALPAAEASPAEAPPPVPPPPALEEVLMGAFRQMPAQGFIQAELQKAASRQGGWIENEVIKNWVRRKIREGVIRVVESRTGRLGSRYAACMDRLEAHPKPPETAQEPADAAV